MATSPPRPPVRIPNLTDGEVNFYRRYGYLALPGFLDPEAVEPLRNEVLEVMASEGFDRARLDRAEETADKMRQANHYLAGSLLDELINGKPSLALASRLIGGPATRFLPFTAIKAGGGGGQFHFHQDNNYTRHDLPLGSINIWVALDDMVPENGCLLIVPESHRSGALDWVDAGDGDRHRKVATSPEGAVPIRMRAGDAVAFTRLTVHGSGPNVTGRARIAYGLNYHRDDVKFLDTETGDWKLLVDEPRFRTPPVERL